LRARSLFQHASIVLGAGLMVMAAGVLPAQAASPAGWRLTATVGAATQGSTGFGDFVVTGRKDAWLGATTFNDTAHSEVPVIEHWNGSSWRQVSLKPPAGFKVLSALGAASSRDVWAFSWDRHVALHWNGVNWKAVTMPTWVIRPAGDGGFDLKVAVFGPHDVLVFSMGAGAYAAHYNGSKWTKMRLPAIAFEVRAVSRQDIWLATNTHGFKIMHWNGRSWRKLTLPRVQVPKGATESVNMLPASGRDSVWLQRTIQRGSSLRTLYWQHWNGKKWSRVYPPHKVAASVLAPDGRGGYWTQAQGPAPAYRNYFYHRSAAGHWTRQAAPGTVTVVPANVLDIARVPGTSELLAVGQATNPASGAVTGGPFLALWQAGKP
jgi:hypothetical protein